MTWGVGLVAPAEIDHINILQATFLAMRRAVDQMTISPTRFSLTEKRSS